MQFSVGDAVRVRGTSWIVEDTTSLTDCTLLELSASKPDGTRYARELLVPFDRPVADARARLVAAIGHRRWLLQLRWKVAELRSLGHLRETARASIDILPFQLEPALALIDGTASRFLLADEVGLGKTIQAALMIAELRRRGSCDRALIVVPSGLRGQWCDELKRRFDISATIMDAHALSTLDHSLAHGVNPWSAESVVITSIDFVKQPEVLHGLKGQLRDILIVDEAHHASPGSLRYQAVALLARRSRYVALLTATPHGGDPAAYRALCDIGRVGGDDDRILLFRRTRQHACLPRSRRVHLLPITLTPDEQDMHRLLDLYTSRLWTIGHAKGATDLMLVASVLSKRAFSSAESLAASVKRRLDTMSGVDVRPMQVGLFDCDDEGDDKAPRVCGPAFADAAQEEQALRALLAAASRAATRGDSKLHALRKLVRRVREPIIVFTEYRDTLATLEREMRTLRQTSMIHGGQSSEERRDAISRFMRGADDLLLATDAGAEGLNLHGRCRVVVNLELPWNPIRLEQRIGRVDRIGQRRTVHAINLYAGSTAESTVLARLVRRLDRIHASEIEVAACVLSRAPLPAPKDAPPETCTDTVDLTRRAQAEASRIAASRSTKIVPSDTDGRVLPVTGVRLVSFTAMGVNSAHSIYVVRLRFVNGTGRLVDEIVVALAVPTRPPGVSLPERRMKRRHVRSLAEQMLADHSEAVLKCAAALSRQREAILHQATAPAARRLAQREHDISHIAAGRPAAAQRGLFDQRALKRQLADEEHARAIADEGASRSAVIEAGCAIVAQSPRIEMVLLTW